MMEQFWVVDNHYLWRNKRLLLDENIDQGGHFFRERNKVVQNQKKNTWILYSKNVWHILKRFVGKSRIYLLLLKSVIETYLQFFYSKNTSIVFSNISFFKSTLFDFGNPNCMWNWQNRTLCHKHFEQNTIKISSTK